MLIKPDTRIRNVTMKGVTELPAPNATTENSHGLPRAGDKFS